MVSASDVIGRKVVIRQGGQEAGKIKDVVVDSTGRQVLGFVISGGLIGGARVAPWAALQAIGPDSVILTAADSMVKAGDAPDIKAALDKDLEVRGLKLQTTQGKDLGKIEDFRFDERTGVVEGYELAGGLFSHRSFLPTPISLELGKDLAFVAPEAESTIQSS
ncbi:MAG: PRC-barrel domain-containing protein [Actinobacteria bacterium]|nr:PRC-barrel domain-containing protein [Actinomycetota bacterium]